MRTLQPALCLPAIRPGLVAGMLLVAAAAAWSQGTLIDPRDPALYRQPASTGTGSCRVCGEIRSIREVRFEPNRRINTPSNQLVFGAVVLLPFGPGAREDPYVGGVGTQEMAERMGTSGFEIIIRMDHGELQILQRRDAANFRVGERVTVSGGIIAPL
jgi:hypothetical protein